MLADSVEAIIDGHMSWEVCAIFVAMMAFNSLSYFGAVVLYHSAPHSPAAFNTGDGIAMAPFGLHCLLIGYLIFRSIFLPRILGILMALAGLGYLTFLWPRLGSHLFFPWIVIPGVAGEGMLTLWLLVIGVNVQRWKQRANPLPVGGGTTLDSRESLTSDARSLQGTKEPQDA